MVQCPNLLILYQPMFLCVSLLESVHSVVTCILRHYTSQLQLKNSRQETHSNHYYYKVTVCQARLVQSAGLHVNLLGTQVFNVDHTMQEINNWFKGP